MRFTKEQTDFIKREIGVDVPFGCDVALDKKQWSQIKDEAFMIEAEEARPDGELSKKCRIAVELCNMRFS